MAATCGDPTARGFRALLALGALLAAGCRSAPAPLPAAEGPAPAQITAIPVTPACARAVSRQVDNSGFAVVISADELLSAGGMQALGDLFRRVRGIPCVRSVRDAGQLLVLAIDEMDLAAEPLVPAGGLAGAGLRERLGAFQEQIDPALLSADGRTTALLAELGRSADPKSDQRIRESILSALSDLPAGWQGYVVEYPVAAGESLRWQDRRARQALALLNRELAGGGLLEVGVACEGDDCLLEPRHLAAIDRFCRIAAAQRRVRAVRSLVDTIRAARKARSGDPALPGTQEEALGLLAALADSGGMRHLADERFQRAVVRVHFETGNAADYCTLGRNLKKAAREASGESLVFTVIKPGRSGM
ncbi:MAG: hypothetical protein JXR96_18565 [Deltaproteobacteria bacterium]|nr:hypothetical protein [Deltaproteobacteria bacterium]